MDVVETGQSKRQLDRRKQLGAVIEEKGGTTGRDYQLFWIWAGNGILDAPTRGFGREDATPPMLKMGIGV